MTSIENNNNDNNGNDEQWDIAKETALLYKLGVYTHTIPVNELSAHDIDYYHGILGSGCNQLLLYNELNGPNQLAFIERRKAEIEAAKQAKPAEIDTNDTNAIRNMVSAEDRRVQMDKTAGKIVETLDGIHKQVKENAKTVDNLARDKMKHNDHQEKAQRLAYKARGDMRDAIYIDKNSDILGKFVDAAADVINTGVPKAKRVPVNIMQPGILTWMIVQNHTQSLSPNMSEWQTSLRGYDEMLEELQAEPTGLTKREKKLWNMLTVNMEFAIAGDELAKVFEGWSRNLIVGTIGSNVALEMLLNKAANNKYDTMEKDTSLHTRLLEEKWYDISFLESNKRFMQLEEASDAAIAARKANVAKPRQPIRPTPTQRPPRYNPYNQQQIGRGEKICNKDHRGNGCNRFRMGNCKFLHPRTTQLVKNEGYQPVHAGYVPAKSQRWAPHHGYAPPNPQRQLPQPQQQQQPHQRMGM